MDISSGEDRNCGLQLEGVNRMHNCWPKGAACSVLLCVTGVLVSCISGHLSATGTFATETRAAETDASGLRLDISVQSQPESQAGAGSAGGSSPAAAQDSTAKSPAAELVERLGHDSWHQRSQAAAALRALGSKAVDALRAGLQHPDAHVRRQCRRLLIEVLETDTERRLAAFVAGKEEAFDSPLPGWRMFSRLVGSDAAARELFADMYRAESPVLEMLETKPKLAGELLFARLSDSGTARGLPVQPLPPGTDVEAFFRGLGGLQGISTDAPRMAVLLFVLTHPDVQPHLYHNIARIGVLRSVITVLSSQPCVNYLSSHKHRSPLKRLLRLWLETPEHIELLPPKVALIEKYKLEEALPWAFEVVLTCQRNEPPISGHFRQQLVLEATKALALVGGMKHAAALERLLECDEPVITVAGRPGVGGWSVQIRDLALAWLVYLTEQDFEQYGLQQAKAAFDQIRKNPQHSLGLPSLRMDDQTREKALARWADYVTRNPLPPLPAQYKSQQAKVTILAPFSALPRGAAQPPRPLAVAPQEHTVVLAERNTVNLLRAAEELLARRDFAAAVAILLRILSQPENAAFQPESGLGLFRFTKSEALRLVGSLPAEGLRMLRIHCEDLARHELNAALGAGDLAAVYAVAEKYLGTEAADEAALLTALAGLSRGRAPQAAAMLDRLRRQSPDAHRLEPELSAWLAICWLRAGRPDEAQRAMANLADHGGSEVRVFGKSERLPDRPDAALAWLQEKLGLAESQARPAQVFGRQVDGQSAVGDTPHVRGQILMPLTADSQIAQLLQQVRRAEIAECRPTVPRISALVVGQTAVTRTLSHIAAVDVNSGQLMWENLLSDALSELLDSRRGGGGRSAESLSSQSLAAAVRRRVWEDGIFGAITSNGRYVFGVEELTCGLGPQYKRTVLDANGMRRWESEPARPTANVLTAYDIRTGKLIWEIGGPVDSWQPAAGAFFLGPPLPLGNALFVLAEMDEEIRLLELRADTGALISETVLASRLKPEGSALWPLPYRPSDALRRQGSTPAFAEGVLVCQTSEHDFAAIDLLTRQLLWLYTLPEDETGPTRRQIILGGRGLDAAQTAPQTARWLDSGVVLASGVAIIAPAQGNRLLGIALRDGRLLWSVPRRDALFVGGADAERVVLVGRSEVRALRLSDGTPAWPEEQLLPPGAAPGGRGIIAANRFHLPLSTGDLLIVDIRSGKLIAQCRTWDELPVGDVVAFPAGAVSINIEGLVRLEFVGARLQRLETALQQRPEDADLLTEYSAALLADNRPAEAFEHLLRALRLAPSDTARLLLVDAIRQGLRDDYDSFHKLVPRAWPLLEKTEQFQAAILVWAGALRAHGESKAAIEAYLSAAAAESRPSELRPAESLRRVRRDRFWAAELAATYAAADSSQQAALDELITAHLREPRMLAFLGWHRAAESLRLQQARQLAEKEPLRAELLLRQLFSNGQPEQQRAAAALLASLLRDNGQTLDAAQVYRFLLERWPDEVCLDGKTGRELVVMLPADDPVRKLLDAPPMWPDGKVYIEALAGGRQTSSVQEMWATVVPVEDSPGRPVSHAMLSATMSMTLVDAHGRQRAKVQFERGAGMAYFPAASMYSQVYTLGRLVVAFVGSQMHVVQVGDDLPDGAKTLWWRTLGAEQPMGLGVIWAVARGSGLFAMPASGGLPIAVSPEAVCLLTNRKLMALDPLTGEVLWVRDEMPAAAGLFGDGRRLVVASKDGSEAELLDMLDGRTIARCIVPPAEQRMWTLGTQIVTWETAQRTGTLGLYDPLEGKYLWQRKYESGPKAWPISPQEVAVCDEQGRLEIVALPSGRLLCSAQLDSPPQLRDLIVHNAFGQYVVIVNHGFAAVASAAGNTVPIEGMAYGIEATSGRLRWSVELSQCGLRLGGPTDIPLVVFELSAMVRRGLSYQQLTKLMCIDKRTGVVLVEREVPGRFSQQSLINYDPEGRRIEVLGQHEAFRFHFTDEREQHQQKSPK